MMIESEQLMGAFDVAKPIVIPDPNDEKAATKFREKWHWEPHEQCIIKSAYTGVEQEEVDNTSSSLKGRGKNRDVQVSVGTARNKLLEVMILDWTFQSGGRKVEVSARSILRLPANYRTPILSVIDEIARTMDEEEEEDFLHSANGHSRESSDETSLSPMPS